MRLRSSVLGAMRGLGGAVLIAAAASGCASSPPPAKVVQPQPIVVAEHDTTTIASDGSGAEDTSGQDQVEHVQQIDLESVPPPCGRG